MQGKTETTNNFVTTQILIGTLESLDLGAWELYEIRSLVKGGTIAMMSTVVE